MRMQVNEFISTLPKIDSGDMILVGIDGCGGAGKSTLADELTAI